MLDAEEIESLKADFLEWTGGFEPETDNEIATYVRTSLSVEIDEYDANRVLRDWMVRAAQVTPGAGATTCSE